MELFEQIRREYEFGDGTVLGIAQKLGAHRRMVRQALANAAPLERQQWERKRQIWRHDAEDKEQPAHDPVRAKGSRGAVEATGKSPATQQVRLPNESGAAPNVRWATDVVWRRILTRAEVPHRPIGQCRHSFAVLALKQHKPLNWIQRQMGHRALQMLLKHYWRWIPTDDLSAEEMSSLESAAAPQASNHAHPMPTTRPENGTQAGS